MENMGKKASILVVDDVAENIEIIFQLLNAEYKIIASTDPVKGLELALTKDIDLILLDIMMPVMDGYQFAEQFNEKYEGKIPIPIIFVTAKAGEDHEYRGFEVGSCDYINKPINAKILKARIKPHIMTKQLLEKNLVEKKTIERMNAEMVEEKLVAKEIFDNMIKGVDLTMRNSRIKIVPKNIFCGDLLFFCKVTDEEYNFMLGDFTGHGLGPSLGYIPVTETFVAMSKDGFKLTKIISKLNDRLYNILPAHVVCAACIGCVDFKNNKVALWNGWSPPIIHVNTNKEILNIISSFSLPLGAQSAEKFSPEIKEISLNTGESILLFSDGVTESRNEQQEMLGDEKIHQFIRECPDHMNQFEHILNAIAKFRGPEEPSDDITLCEIYGDG